MNVKWVAFLLIVGVSVLWTLTRFAFFANYEALPRKRLYQMTEGEHLTSNTLFKPKYKTIFPSTEDTGPQDDRKASGFKVPNIVHYVWSEPDVWSWTSKDHEFNLWRIIGPISAYENLKPDKILLHSNKKPTGNWWDELLRIVPVEYKYYPTVKTVFGNYIEQPAHRSDVTRIDILRKYGGIYLDFDVVVLKSFDPLRIYDCVLGVETGDLKITNGLPNAGIILSKPNSTFLNKWYDGYKDYRGSVWLHNSAVVPNQIRQTNPELMHIEPNFWHDTSYAIFGGYVDLSEKYAYHMWVKAGLVKYPARGVKSILLMPGDAYKLHNTFGELLRRFYVDSYWTGDTKFKERFH